MITLIVVQLLVVALLVRDERRVTRRSREARQWAEHCAWLDSLKDVQS
ncbi:hypothetical protein SAMN05892883_2100 [Jatrophihabitans sp. GAS493]|nr:hypothetical protein [Jatrophihabitans sp. GAS493]SOD72755.1 hypothetical protein SAMN05892883_2100 [Jatrophihabitans sp. GAS493]